GRFPHQFANWFGMTVLFGPCASFTKCQLTAQQNDTERRRAKTTTHILCTTWLSALPTNFQFIVLPFQADGLKYSLADTARIPAKHCLILLPPG
ncbi:MAG: hypothetical protein ACI4P4_00765, partial [Faecousia sp.]